MSYNILDEVIEEKDREIERLLGIIEDAPHHGCSAYDDDGIHWGGYCDCWKSKT